MALGQAKCGQGGYLRPADTPLSLPRLASEVILWLLPRASNTGMRDLFILVCFN